MAFRSSFSRVTALFAAGREAPALVGVRVEVVAVFEVADAGPLPVSFSRALVLVWTGLEVCSLSLLKGEPTSDLFPPSFPDESPDMTRPDAGRVIPRLAPIVEVLTVGRVGPPGLPVVEDTEACRVVLEAGNAGGPMEVLVPAAEGRVRVPAPIEETRALEGVPVRELAALDAAVDPSCFVGDFVGDC